MNEENILNNINLVAEKLFKSVENQGYKILDEIMVIGPNILKDEPLKNICNIENTNGIIIIANSFLLFYVIYFAFMQIINLYNGNSIENLYKFIIKSIIIGILINCSYFLCSEILNLFFIFTNTIDELFNDISGVKVNFENLKEIIVNIDDLINDDILSLNGIIKGVISFGFVSIIINFAIRYVTIIFIIIISPFAFLSLESRLTSGIFKSWGKLLIVNLLVQIVVKFIILIPIMYKDVNSIMYKIILVGSIYLIYSVNMFTKEIFSKITENTSTNNLFKGE